MLILGIDPGKSGGCAVLSIDDATGKPRCEPSLFKLDQEEKAIADLFWKISFDASEAGESCHAFLEKVHAMPAINRIQSPDGAIKRQEVFASVVSVGSFMQNYGFLRGCLVAVGIEFDEIRPQDWQKALGCMTRGDKNVSKQKALSLYPTLKITHATADSLLLAEFGRRARSNFSRPAPVMNAAMVGASAALQIQDGDVPF